MLLVEDWLVPATALLIAAVLLKPQGIIDLPVLFFALCRERSLKAWLKVACSALITTLVIVLPFALGQQPLWLFKLYAGTVGEYPYASVNAFNIFGLLGANYKLDTTPLFLFSYRTWGLIFIVLTTLFAWWIYVRGRRPRFAAAAAFAQFVGVFTFATGMHERYLFPAAALGLLAYIYLRDRWLLWISISFSLTIFVNTYVIYYHAGGGGSAYSPTLFLTACLNVGLCALLAKVLWDGARTRDRLSP